jgi:hypothetical protein
VSAKWAGRRSNPRNLIFNQALYRLSYQPNANDLGRPLRSAGTKEKGPASYDTGPCGSLKSKTECHIRLFLSLAGAQSCCSFARWANAVQDGNAVSDKRMKLGLEYIISVTSRTIIPHTGAKVSIDFYKSVRSAIGSCNISKNFSDLRHCENRYELGCVCFVCGSHRDVPSNFSSLETGPKCHSGPYVGILRRHIAA